MPKFQTTLAEIIDTYKTIKSTSEGFYSEKGSKFISIAIPIRTEAEMKENLQAIKKKYFDARHHVYAFVLGDHSETFRASDDGEPANSSGMPVLGQIRSYELTYVMIVVVRYFGGTKLGIPGLINAYRTAASDALDKAEIVEETINASYSLSFTYDEMNFVMKCMKDFDAKIVAQYFTDDCRLDFEIKLSLEAPILDALSKNYKVVVKKKEDE